MMRTNIAILILVAGLSFHARSCAQTNSSVRVVGAMKNVMRKGQLQGSIRLDTIADKTNLYGIGPMEYLAGELMVVNGRSFKSIVVSETEMTVVETFEAKAPFFVYGYTADWREVDLPRGITTGQQLEAFLIELNAGSEIPFTFKLTGRIDKASIHIVNLPKGSNVASPDDAHKGQVNYSLNDEEVTIVGFFSLRHKAIFTHHDTFIHMHLITDDQTKMGHLDSVDFKQGSMKLFVPK